MCRTARPAVDERAFVESHASRGRACSLRHARGGRIEVRVSFSRALFLFVRHAPAALLVGGCAPSPGVEAESSADEVNRHEPETSSAVTLEPDTFASGEADVVSVVRTASGRRPISPLLYGLNRARPFGTPQEVLDAVTFIRRGGDRANAYNWETNVSNGSHQNAFANDLYLAEGLAGPSEPGGVDLALIRQNRKDGRGTMVPFVLNDWVAGPVSGPVPYEAPDFDRSVYFRRVGLVKPTPLSSQPDLTDGFVYTDEHLHAMREALGEDIYAPGPAQVMVGIDNEPDLYSYNFPMLQEGGGAMLYGESGAPVGTRVTGSEFTQRFLTFAKRVKELAPAAAIVGPSHYHFDGFTAFHDELAGYSNAGEARWYMDDFLSAVKAESDARGQRLLDTWDFHWYPQHVSDGRFVWDLDDSVRPLTEGEIEHIVQSPRSYWDEEYDEDSWITRDHLFGPAFILGRLKKRIDAAYPGTHLGVSEYFPGGCAHIASGVAVADSLGVFATMGVHLAALWPTCDRLEYAYGALELVRNADGRGLGLGGVLVSVEHPEKRESSLYAGSADARQVTALVVNKSSAKRRFGLRLFHEKKLSRAAVYRIEAGSPRPHLASEGALSKTNAYLYEAPPLSASLVVFTTAE
jgi:hypothetical protein